MTPPGSLFDGGLTLAVEAAERHVGNICYAAADGRRASRALAQWCQPFGISETETQILWCLHASADSGFDQTSLAKRLAYSPALVSTTMERLRIQGWVEQQPTQNDRRRNLWYLSAAGSRVIGAMLHSAHELRLELTNGQTRAAVPPRTREEAA